MLCEVLNQLYSIILREVRFEPKFPQIIPTKIMRGENQSKSRKKLENLNFLT